MTIATLAFRLALYLTAVHFRSQLQHTGDVGEQKIKCRPIRTRKVGGVRLQDELFMKMSLGLGFFEMFTTDISDDVLRRMSDIRDPIRHPQDVK